MMCHSIGLPPISTIGFGRTAVSSLSREPKPPARITAFIVVRLLDAAHVTAAPHRSLTPTTFEAPSANGKAASYFETTRN
jgi:hypothetical protein